MLLAAPACTLTGPWALILRRRPAGTAPENSRTKRSPWCARPAGLARGPSERPVGFLTRGRAPLGQRGARLPRRSVRSGRLPRAVTDDATASAARKNPLSLIQGLDGTTRATIVADVIAGATLAAVAIPESMGYTKIAGMPVITGIYTLALPVIVFALIGSSRHLVVGADSATAAIMFAALIGIAKPASPEYVGLAAVIALLAAGYLLVARLLRLGFLADFLSRTALVGFLSGVGVQVALTQLPSMLGIHASGSVVNQMGK